MWVKQSMSMGLKWPLGCQVVILGLLLLLIWQLQKMGEEKVGEIAEARQAGLAGRLEWALLLQRDWGWPAPFSRSRDIGRHPRASAALLPAPAPGLMGRPGAGEAGAVLTHPSAATFCFDVLMFQFWQPERQWQQAACPSSRLTSEQLLARLSGDFKGGKLPWDSFSKAPS